MNNYVTTNIRIPEEDYLRLKEEAFKKRASLSAIIREKIANQDQRSKKDIEKILNKRKEVARTLSKQLQGVDIVKVLREMRYKGKW